MAPETTGPAGQDRVTDSAATVDAETLRATFLGFLTVDSDTKDRRRRDYNQAIFDRERGYAIWSSTDLNMVMEKFDKALRVVLDGT